MNCPAIPAILMAHLLVLCCWLSGWAQSSARPDAKSIFERGERALLNQQYDEAERDFQRVIALQANSAAAYANLGTVYLRTNRTAAAIRTLRQAERLAPRVAAIRLDLGLAYFRKQDFKRAAEQFAFVISADRNNLQARYLKGTCDFMIDDFKQAVAAWEPIQPQEQDDLEYLYMLGVSYGMLKQNDQANRTFEQLVKAGKDSPHLHLLLGKAYLALHENEKAEKELQQAASAEALPFAHYYLGVLYQKTGRFEQAAAEFEEENEVAPDNPWGYKDLSDLKLDRGDAAGAVVLLQKGTTRNPDASELFANLGRAYLQTGDLPHSIAAFKRALTLDPGNSSYHLQLGRALLKAGHNKEAGSEIARGRALANKTSQSEMQAFSRDQHGETHPDPSQP